LLDNNWDASNIFNVLSEFKNLELESDLNVYNFDKQNKVLIGYKPDGSVFFGCPQIGTIEGFLTPRAKLEVSQSIDLKNRGTIEPAIVLSFQSFSEDELKSISTIFAGLYDLNKNSFGKDDASKASQGFKEYFSKIPKITVSREVEIGLFGELTAIFASNSKEYLIKGWHSTPNATYDFSLEGKRLEVKTSSRPSRHVWLRASQTIKSTVNELTYLSIYATEDHSGVTINELVTKIKTSITQVTQQELDNKLSFYEIEKCKLKFDLTTAIQSFKFVSGTEVPIIKNDDNRILDFNWKCSFELLPHVELPNTWSSIMGIER
jgi:hypothetical protein